MGLKVFMSTTETSMHPVKSALCQLLLSILIEYSENLNSDQTTGGLDEKKR